MAPLPSRKALEAMKRTDLQRLCKDYGVKANLKSEALIDLLLDSEPVSVPPNRRSVSTRRSSRAGPSRITSLIIHDTGNEQEQDNQPETSEDEDHKTDSGLTERPTTLPPPPHRTRKAQELQTRLGVGRPAAAGGSGARDITKSTSLPRAKRGKPSKLLNRVEATIVEEEPESSMTEPTKTPNGISTNPMPIQLEARAPSRSEIAAPMPDISEQIEQAVRPLHAEIQTLKSEVQQVQLANAELHQLRARTSDFSRLQSQIDSLAVEVRELRAQAALVSLLGDEVKQLRQSIDISASPPLPSTPKPKSPRLPLAAGIGFPSSFKMTPLLPGASGSAIIAQGSSTADTALPHPGMAPSMLGKRHRDSGDSIITGVVEEGQANNLSEEQFATQVLRPNKKRLKLLDTDGQTDAMIGSGQNNPPTSNTIENVESHYPTHRVPSFSVFSGPDELSESYLDPAPPTTHLPDLFAPPSPPTGSSDLPSSRNGQGTTSSAHNTENQHPFNFSFLPISSTPVNAIYMPPFPYPDPPQSPSPAGPTLGGYLSHNQDERNDIFKSFGLPSPSRPRLQGLASGSQQQDGEASINPAVLTRRSGSSGKQRATSNEIAAGLGLTAVRTMASTDPGNDPEPPPAKKTMYGTELEGDTRFGDFGVEGVASGFWAGGRI